MTVVRPVAGKPEATLLAPPPLPDANPRFHEPDRTSAREDVRRAEQSRKRRARAGDGATVGFVRLAPATVVLCMLLLTAGMAVCLTHRVAASPDVNERALNASVVAGPVALIVMGAGFLQMYVNIGGALQRAALWLHRAFGHADAEDTEWIRYVGVYNDTDIEPEERLETTDIPCVVFDGIALAGALFCTLMLSSADLAVLPFLFAIPWMISALTWRVHNFPNEYYFLMYRFMELVFMGASMGCLMYVQPAPLRGWNIGLACTAAVLWCVFMLALVHQLRGDIDGDGGGDDIRSRCVYMRHWFAITSMVAAALCVTALAVVLFVTRSPTPGGAIAWWDALMCGGLAVCVSSIPVAVMAWSPTTLMTLLATLSTLAAFVRVVLEGATVPPPITAGVCGGVLLTWGMSMVMSRAGARRYAFRTFDNET